MPSPLFRLRPFAVVLLLALAAAGVVALRGARPPSAQVATQTAAFSDVVPGARYAVSIGWAKDSGIVGGYPDGSFRPDKTVGRAELARMLLSARARGETFGPVVRSRFTDVSPQEWYAPFVEAAAERGIVSGYPDGTFRAGAQVTVAEAMKMVARAYALAPSVRVADSPWYLRDSIAVQEAGAFLEEFRGPGDALTRGQLAEMLYRLARRAGSSVRGNEETMRAAAPAPDPDPAPQTTASSSSPDASSSSVPAPVPAASSAAPAPETWNGDVGSLMDALRRAEAGGSQEPMRPAEDTEG